MLIDRSLWDGFARDYSRYADGDPKLPFSLLRESLGSIIENARACAYTANDRRAQAVDGGDALGTTP